MSDNGIPPLTSTTRVVVTIEDVNDKAPRFVDRNPRIRILELVHDGMHDVPLYRVVAYDLDAGPNGDIDFSIKGSRGNSRFRIHPKTGMIYATKSLDKNTEHSLIVSPAHSKKKYVKGSVTVSYIFVYCRLLSLFAKNL